MNAKELSIMQLEAEDSAMSIVSVFLNDFYGKRVPPELQEIVPAPQAEQGMEVPDGPIRG